MNFLAPGRLALLILVAALAGLYVWVQRRRRHAAVRFTNVALLAEVAPARPGWRRHVPAAAVALALAALVVSIAEPVHSVRVPQEAATIMLVIDVSASMDATDVAPTRLQAAVAAGKSFVNDLPPQARIGLISFSRTAQVIASPTVDHQAVVDGIDRLLLGTGTATGDAIYTALDALAAANDTAGAAPTTKGGSAIVLLSDGVPTVGRPVPGAAQEAANQGVPISTIAFGTADGTVTIGGRMISVPADPDTMASIAETTNGKFFKAASEKQLRSIYKDIGTRVGYETEQHDASGPVLTLAVVALLVASGLALMWNGRLL
ncbi:MAG TPA: VWA domain-containing protein [Acidimicrobiia bacterium]|nr:VWA domain-containing protein [Acidimicrobiia bacterium]HTC82153.1 VWA domain-containing protein [Acidimicrobiia bacterium]